MGAFHDFLFQAGFVPRVGMALQIFEVSTGVIAAEHGAGYGLAVDFEMSPSQTLVWNREGPNGWKIL